MKLAVHKDTHECVAVKVVHVDGSNGLTRENLRKEVSIELQSVFHEFEPHHILAMKNFSDPTCIGFWLLSPFLN